MLQISERECILSELRNETKNLQDEYKNQQEATKLALLEME